jgi:hypothetical protein
MEKVLTQALPLTWTPMPNRHSKTVTTLINRSAHGMAEHINWSRHGISEKIEPKMLKKVGMISKSISYPVIVLGEQDSQAAATQISLNQYSYVEIV